MASMTPKLNEKSGLLELGFHFTDVQEPNLFRNMYPYNDIPKLIFNHRIVPMNLPEKIYITDTTFRDGQQARSPYTVEEICDLFTLLHKLDNGSGIIRQTEFFPLFPKGQGKRSSNAGSWGMTSLRSPHGSGRKRGLPAGKDMGLKETGILVSCSDYHIFKKMHWTRSEALKNYLSVVDAALEAGIVPRCHFEDITRADFYGFVLPFAEKLMEMSGTRASRSKSGPAILWGWAPPFPAWYCLAAYSRSCTA